MQQRFEGGTRVSRFSEARNHGSREPAGSLTPEGWIVKKLTLAAAMTLALIATVPAHGQSAGGTCPAGFKPGSSVGSCVPVASTAVPEPSSFEMLGVGLSLLGGFLVLRRKRLLRNP